MNKDIFKINAIAKKAEKQEKAISDMVGMVADNANAGRYIKYSKNALIISWILFTIGMGIMAFIASTIYVGYVVNISFQDWYNVFPRILSLFVVLMPAFFCMREAKKQRDKSFQFKDMECRIITSAQFIDSLDLTKTEKDAMKAKLVESLFGKPMEYCSDGGLPPIEHICDIIKACLEKRS